MESEDLMKDADRVDEQSQLRIAAPVIVHLIFFLSGIAALVYEVSWNRLVGLAIGNTAQAAALVLASYFTGLAVGQLFGGWFARRMHPLFGYGVAEIVAAAWACVIPELLDWIGAPAEYGDWDSLRATSLSRATCCFLILLPSTIPLGATLPLVVEYLSISRASKRHITLAYGLNTAGGLIGIVAALAILLIFVGVRSSGYLAAGISAACGSAAIIVARMRPGLNGFAKEASDSAHCSAGNRAWLAAAALSGFGTLGLEVLFMRMFTLVFHNSSYTFGAVVAVFLLALSVGAIVASFCANRFSPHQLATFAFSLGGLCLAGSVVLFARATGLNYFESGNTFASYLAGSFGLVVAFVLPPVMFLGIAFPAVLRAAADRGRVGWFSAINTLAGALGALAAGFVLPLILGLWTSFGLFVALFMLAGVLLLGRRRWVASTVLVLAGIGAAYVGVGGTPLARDESSKFQLLRRWETAYGWVDVIRNEQSGALSVHQNLHYRHGSSTLR